MMTWKGVCNIFLGSKWYSSFDMCCTQDLYEKEALDFAGKSNKKKHWQRYQTK